MKACLIAPIPDLGRYVDDNCTHHLLLAHLFDAPNYGEPYARFYRRRAERGDYLIMDNGAAELGAGVGLEATLARGRRVAASEVVLTDVRFSAADTLHATRDDLAWLRSPEGREAYELAGRPALMIVPQGDSFNAWKACYERLRDETRSALADLGELSDKLVAGMAYAYDHVFPQVPFERLVEQAYEQHTIHILGWPRRLRTLTNVAAEFPKLRSVDSSKPFRYAKAGRHLGEPMPTGRDVEFFFDAIPSNYERVVRDNINAFRMCARDQTVLAA